MLTKVKSYPLGFGTRDFYLLSCKSGKLSIFLVRPKSVSESSSLSLSLVQFILSARWFGFVCLILF